MNSLSRIFYRIGSRGLLLALAGVLLLVKLGFMLQESYVAKQADLESRQANLARHRKLAAKAPELKAQLQRLNDRREKLGKILFTGSSEENIISAMQLDLQALVTTAGLEVESIRPTKQKNAKAAGKGEAELGEVAIKASLAGTLAGFQALLAQLYSSEKFYKIETVTLSPYKKAELKILMDLRGYFIVTAPETAASVEGGGGPARMGEGGASAKMNEGSGPAKPVEEPSP